MPKRSVYIREVDQPVWQRAEKLAGDSGSFSRMLSDALRFYLSNRPPERQVVPVWDDDLGRLVRKSFKGRWLIAPQEEWRSGAAQGRARCFAVARTAQGHIAVHCWDPSDPRFEPSLDTFDSLEEAVSEALPDDLYYLLGEIMVAEVAEDLDI